MPITNDDKRRTYFREYMRARRKGGESKATIIARLEAEIAALKAAARAGATRERTTAAATASFTPRRSSPAAPASGAQLAKFIRHLGNANPHEAEIAATKLISGLAASESDRNALASLWEKHVAERVAAAPPKPKPIDWPEVSARSRPRPRERTK
jgi:hypothetical protein